MISLCERVRGVSLPNVWERPRDRGEIEMSAEGYINRWWRVVGGLSMNLALGSAYAWSVFVAPLEKDFGWKRADTAMIFTILIFVFAISFVLAGRLQDKKGPFWVSVIGGVLVSIGFFLSAWTTSLAWIFFWLGAIGGIGNGFGYATPIPVMAKWFPDRPVGWVPAPAAKAAATTYEFAPSETLRTPTFYLMWIAYCLGTAAGLMVISQLVPFARSQGVPLALATTAILIGAVGNAAGRILSGWMSDTLGRLNVLRLMIAISAVAMPILAHTGGIVDPPLFMFVMVFIVYWCYGTQLSVNASTTSDFWGTKNAGINYGMLFTSWGVAGIVGPRIGGVLFDKYGNYQAAFYTAAGLAVIALIAELLARRPAVPEAVPAGARARA